MTPDEEADRRWIMASELRRTADHLEGEARAIRPSRTPMNHRRYFRLLWDRDCAHLAALMPAYGWPRDEALCTYCDMGVHPHEDAHVYDVYRECVNVDGSPVPYWGRCANIEHRLPVARGGTNDIDNLALACQYCNRRKGTMTELEYRVMLAIDLLDWSDADEQYPNWEGTLGRALMDMIHLVGLLAPEHRDRFAAWCWERRQVIETEVSAERQMIIGQLS